MLTPHEQKQIRYLQFVGPKALLRPYVELLIGRAITDAEFHEVLNA